jgi:hypothetical protein
VAQHPTSAVTEAKRLLLSGPGSSLRSRYDAENTVMVTTLKPPPMKVMFAGFLGRRGDT